MEKKVIPLKRKDVEVLLRKIDKKLAEAITIYLIGGGSMALKELKDSTIDLDFVVISKRKYVALKKAIEKTGYKLDETSYDSRIYKNAVILFAKGRSKIDIFIKSIVGMLDFTKEMENRAELLDKNFDKLRIKLASNEDIFLLKSMSGRDKDIIDCRTLLLTGLKSDIIVKECVKQHREDTKWIFWLYETLCKLENRYGITVKFKRRVWQECRQNWEFKPRDFMDSIKNIEKHIKEKKFRDKVKKDLEDVKYHHRDSLIRDLV